MKLAALVAGRTVLVALHQTLVGDRLVLVGSVHVERVVDDGLLLPGVALGHQARHVAVGVEGGRHILILGHRARVQFEADHLGAWLVARAQQHLAVRLRHTSIGQTEAKLLLAGARLVQVFACESYRENILATIS